MDKDPCKAFEIVSPLMALLGVSGKWCACGWSVVQRDHDEEMEPMHGMYGTLDAVLEFQRTIRKELS